MPVGSCRSTHQMPREKRHQPRLRIVSTFTPKPMPLAWVIVNFRLAAGRPQSGFQASRTRDAPDLVIFAVTQENGAGVAFELNRRSWRQPFGIPAPTPRAF